MKFIPNYDSLNYFIMLFLALSFSDCQYTYSNEKDVPKEQERCMRIFSGYDQRTRIGFHVCEESIIKHSSLPVSFTPLDLRTLKRIYTRPREKDQLTDFTFTRFLVVIQVGLCSLMAMICWFEMISVNYLPYVIRFAVMVVKHPNFREANHTFMDKTITMYPMFNWSSVMLFNNAQCKMLTPEIVNTANRLDLHQFKWLESPELIGEIPSKWNHLVGYYEPRPDVSLVHWTMGAPFQGEEFAKTEYADEWFAMEQILIEHNSAPQPLR